MAGRVLSDTAAAPSRIDWPAALKESRPRRLRRARPVPAPGRHADGQDRGRHRPQFPFRLGADRGRPGRRRPPASGRPAHGATGQHRGGRGPAHPDPGAARTVRRFPGGRRPGVRLRAAVPAVRQPLCRRRRDHRADLRDARLGPEHRGRPRRAAGSRLRRVLRGRGLFLRAVRPMVRSRLLGMSAAGRRAGGVVRHPARLSGAPPAR